jgi:hypothetical protein
VRVYLMKSRTTTVAAGLMAIGILAAPAASFSATTLPPPLTVVNYTVGSGVFAIEGVTVYANGGVGLAGFGVSQSLRQLGVYGSASGPTGIGVYGVSSLVEAAGGPTTANETVGVYGIAPNGYGVEGTTGVEQSPYPGLFSGILGLDGSANFGNNDGILGITNNGYFGVQGIGGNGSVGGVYGSADGGNYGVFGESGLVGVEGSSNGTPLAAANGAGTIVWSVDSSGIVTTTANAQAIVTVRGGASARTFVPNSTTPLLEDVGSAMLVRGASTVRLDPAFGSSISSGVYQVFITPNGESKGLYVQQKKASEFTVRENANGRSTIGFDYRIVAKPFADTGARIAIAPSAANFESPTRRSLLSKLADPRRVPSAANVRALQLRLMQHLRNQHKPAETPRR